MRRRLNIAVQVFLSGFLAAMAACVTAQQPYPTKPIRIIVPLVPGGGSNNVARLFADKLHERLGQPVVVENRPGGNSIVGSEAVARAAADGYTLLAQSGTHVILPFVEPKLPFDPLNDFAPVAILGSARFVMNIHPSIPAKTLKEFIAFAKARPGQINFSSSGTASGSRLAGEMFNMLAGVRMQNIPYKGGAQAQADLIGGHVHVSFNTTMISIAHIQSGRLRGLAISGENRTALLPQVPTFSEAGLPEYDETAWQGLFAPAGTPKPVVDKLSTEISRLLAAPDFKEMLQRQGVEPLIATPEQFAARLRADTAKLVKLIKTANLKFDN